MNSRLVNRILGLTASLLVATCAWGPSVGEVRLGKDREVTQSAKTFNASDTLYAVAAIHSPPENAKVRAQLVVVDAARVKPGPVRGLEMTMDLLPGMKRASFNFMAPPTGWPDGKYRFEVLLLDGTGAEKSRATAEFTTTGHEARIKALRGSTK